MRGAAAMPALVSLLGIRDEALKGAAMRLVSQIAPRGGHEMAAARHVT